MAWKPITLALFEQFRQCLQAKGIPDPYFNEIGECFQQTFADQAPDPEPEPLPPGMFAACSGNQSERGNAPWGEWCTDQKANFTGSGTVLEMRCNAEAKRSRLPGLSKGIAPPTAGSNRVVMKCDLMFREEWLAGVPSGGQHLFQLGEGPYILSNGQIAPDHIRFDFGCFDVGGGNGFRDGFRVLVYHQKNGVHREDWFPSTTKMPGIFVPNVWVPVFVDARYNSSSGVCDLLLRVGSQTRQVSVTVPAGIGPKLGDSIGWGNVDHSQGQNDRPGTVKIQGLEYRVS